MPFTLSHPAASVPLARHGLVLSALVVGSMAPDFAYFTFLPVSHFSHSLPGLLLFCVPSGLAVLWVFHKLLKRPMLSLLPPSHQRRLTAATNDFSFGPWRRLALIVASLVLGALTHVVWDAFTHPYGWAVERVSALSRPLIETPHGALRMYKVLQHGSTLVGAILLCYGYVRWYRQAPASPATPSSLLPPAARQGSVVVMGLGAAAVALVYGLLGASPLSDFEAVRQFVGRTVVAGLAVLFVEGIVFSAFWYLWEQRKLTEVQA